MKTTLKEFKATILKMQAKRQKELNRKVDEYYITKWWKNVPGPRTQKVKGLKAFRI